MKEASGRVSAMSLFPLLQCADAEGLSFDALLAGSRLDAGLLRDPTAMVDFADELVVVGNYLRLTREICPGLHVSDHYHYNSFGVLGAALVSHANMLDACRFLVAHVALTFTPFQVLMSEDATSLVACYRDRCDLAGCRAYYLLRDLAFVRNLCREADPEHWPELVSGMDIALEEPAHSALIRDFFCWPLRFGAAETLIRADKTRLMQPLRLANAMTLEVMQRQCHELLQARQGSWRQRVENQLAASAQPCDLAQVATALCCSERSLRRHLQQEGCSFQELLLAWQQQRAVHFLRHSRLSVESIAHRLGYSETAAFAHAFKRWMGMTPTQFRSQS